MSLIQQIKSHRSLKKMVLWMIASPYTARPRLWVKVFINPFIHTKKGNVRLMARMDLFPFNDFVLGKHSFVEDFCTLNNGVGDIIIGTQSRVGIGSTLIGPVTIGNQVQIAQNVVISGLNHNYEDISVPITEQGVSKAQILIDDDVWIGANSLITAGVHIGTHCVVAGGSVLTKSIPPYTMWGGTPAKLMKSYDFAKKEWIKAKK
jgi:acetyltransferase-like isoleucine patch superfamily enzyme